VARVLEFLAWIEPRLAPGGELADLSGWPTKLGGACVRLAAVLHFCETVGQPPPKPVAEQSVETFGQPVVEPVGQPPAKPVGDTEVSAATVEKAVTLCRDYLLPHARKALGLIAANPLMEAARRVVSVLARREGRLITRRDIHRLGSRLFKKADEVDPVLELLVEYGYLKPKDDPFLKPGKGHKSPEYTINPRVAARE
jgi:hypothetical protein